MPVWPLLLFLGLVGAWRESYIEKTRTVKLRQGDIVGIVSRPNDPALKPVQTFLGVPYAAAPVGNLRFMPPGSPLPWSGVKVADTFGPVCSQIVPDPYKMNISAGRREYLKKITAFLKPQSEDCLNLNIYAPKDEYTWGSRKMPVIMFIHGESFSWNSGNPYDGTILASYGDVIVVTINFRLGIFGFLKQTFNVGEIGNLGLLDQIAALKWIQDNIEAFGGDPNSVTLLGHHTGAIAANYLMLSPMVQGEKSLFKKVIMMSGSALSKGAKMKHPQQMLISVAEQLNCPYERLQMCLRTKRVEELLEVSKLYEFAPIVDGLLIVNEAKDSMTKYTNLFTRYDLMCGVVELEAYHQLSAVALAHGMLDEERDDVLESFFRTNYEKHPEIARAMATSVYEEEMKGRTSSKVASALIARDTTLGILGDSQIVVPVVQTAAYHSKPNPNIQTYLYVFEHRNLQSNYPSAEGSVQGEDLEYVLGIPFEDRSVPVLTRYSQEEKLLSEYVMTLWTNFAKTGDPNAPRKFNYYTGSSRYWDILSSLKWPEFRPNQSYMAINYPPHRSYRYKSNLVNFWSNILPSHLRDIGGKPLKPSQNWYSPDRRQETIGNEYHRAPPQYKPEQYHPRSPSVQSVRPTETPDDAPEIEKSEEGESGHVTTASSFTLSVVIIIGIFFVLINLVLLLYVLRQRRNNVRLDFKSRFRFGSSPSIPDLDTEPKHEIKSILKSNEILYDTIKKPRNYSGFNSQGSSSTVTIDPHAKVAEWMNHRTKPGNMMKLKTDKSSDTDKAPATISRIAKKVKKVSVAVDATPESRSASVLKQIPIEISKSLDSGKSRLGTRPVLQRSDAVSDDEPSVHSNRLSDRVMESASQPTSPQEEKKLKSFEPFPKDINVTCRDDMEEPSMTPEEALDNIKRRNFPKVLPDFPDDEPEACSLLKRMSLPHSEDGRSHKKVPPPPPPRVSTLGRKPLNRNTVPNFMTTHKDLENMDVGLHEKAEKPEKRPEPRVIIKPTLTDPNLKKGNSKIPRVTPPQPIEKIPPATPPSKRLVIKGEKPKKQPGGVGAKLVVHPVKKSASAETATTSGTSGSSKSSTSTVKKSN
ncbi:neuroligin-1-like isoform X2 [Cimex lectularius]|uniref:Carboxylesterase type B domain-containing protein n=1 Tax=Cimex lectularius TaxID=79782 RepID=A0A8I6SDF7_CIMLE|nr:neuroligin-1-like isoform X2 [Cimex lectularius]